MATILVGHVTKDGSVAGPRTLEHLVDVVLHFEGDRHSRLRMVRAVKNRYGPTDEVGCFDLGEYGMIGLADPSGLFLSRHREPVPGTCVTVTLEGRRPLLAEVQALVCQSALEMPRRVTSGLDASRVGMVLAVLQRRADVKIGKSGRVRGDRWRSTADRAVGGPGGRARAGQLGGEPVRPAGRDRGRRGGPGRRGAERGGRAAPGRGGRADGLPPAIVPAGSDAASSGGSSGMEVVEVEDVREAMRAALRD